LFFLFVLCCFVLCCCYRRLGAVCERHCHNCSLLFCCVGIFLGASIRLFFFKNYFVLPTGWRFENHEGRERRARASTSSDIALSENKISPSTILFLLLL
jgi:hypothetical protein